MGEKRDGSIRRGERAWGGGRGREQNRNSEVERVREAGTGIKRWKKTV
jgi:hypothetical protein